MDFFFTPPNRHAIYVPGYTKQERELPYSS